MDFVTQMNEAYDEIRQSYSELQSELNSHDHPIVHMDSSDEWNELASGHGGCIYSYAGELDAIAIIVDGHVSVAERSFSVDMAAAAEQLRDSN